MTNEPETSIGERLRELRTRQGLSMRGLAAQAGVAPSYVSSVEAGRISPTIATLRKLLLVLGEDLAGFFTHGDSRPRGYHFPHAGMQKVADATRQYTLILPRRSDICCEMLDETIHPSSAMPEYEQIGSDLAGYVLAGQLVLEIAGEDPVTLLPGDAFYVPADKPVRGRCTGDTPVRLVTVIVPPRY